MSDTRSVLSLDTIEPTCCLSTPVILSKQIGQSIVKLVNNQYNSIKFKQKKFDLY